MSSSQVSHDILVSYVCEYNVRLLYTERLCYFFQPFLNG